MKKFVIILLVVVFIVTVFTGCDKLKPSEPTEEPIPTNAVEVTPKPELETAEAEEIIIELQNKQ